MPYIFYTLIICMTWALYFIFHAEISPILNLGHSKVGVTFPFIFLISAYAMGILITAFTLPRRFQESLENHAEFFSGGAIVVGMVGTYIGVQGGIDDSSRLGASFAHAINSTMMPMAVGIGLMIIIEMMRFNRNLQKVVYNSTRRKNQKNLHR